jgi:hypothetical protein
MCAPVSSKIHKYNTIFLVCFLSLVDLLYPPTRSFLRYFQPVLSTVHWFVLCDKSDPLSLVIVVMCQHQLRLRCSRFCVLVCVKLSNAVLGYRLIYYP